MKALLSEKKHISKLLVEEQQYLSNLYFKLENTSDIDTLKKLIAGVENCERRIEKYKYTLNILELIEINSKED